MIYDKESDIIEYIKDNIIDKNTLIYSNNNFSKQIFKVLSNLDTFIDNSSHSNQPPDFYSNEYSVMFDIFKINDTEQKKNFNPTKIEERKIERENESFISKFPNAKVFIDTHSEIQNGKITYLVKQTKRVLENHIDKIPIWEREHPNIKHKGLIVFNESEFYSTAKWDGCDYIKEKNYILYEPWLDKNIIENVFSKIDFILWICPYQSSFICKEFPYCPKFVLMDMRLPLRNIKEYDYDKFERT